MSGAKPASGFADNFEVTDYGILYEPFSQEDVAAARHIGFDHRDGVRDMFHVWLVGFHNGRASASMYGRKCRLTLRDSTRSTLRCNATSSASARAR